MKYRLCREMVRTAILEVEAEDPEAALRKALGAGLSEWEPEDGGGFARIDSMTEVHSGDTKCWSVEWNPGSDDDEDAPFLELVEDV